MEVGKERNTEAIDHSNRHEVTIVVDDFSEAENTSPMEEEGDNNGGIPTLNGVAVVHEGLVSERRDGKTLLLESRENPSNEQLEEEIARVHFPRIKVGACILEKTIGKPRN